MPPIVTLLSDFGTPDGYVGAMKGVILAIAPDVTLIDLTHEIPAQDITAGARALREAACTFPAGTIHVAVVDPGVGTARRPLLLVGQQLYIGPDNGLLSLAAEAQARGYVLDRPWLHRQPVSQTFHGRDIFASVAGHLAAGLEVASCGSPTNSWQILQVPLACRNGARVVGQVVHVDRFGNLISNITKELAAGLEGGQVTLGARALGPVRGTFGDVAPGEWVAYWGSGGALEIGIRNENAASQLAPAEREVTLCDGDVGLPRAGEEI